MPINSPDILPYVLGTSTQCDLASRVVDLITLVNEVKDEINSDDADIGNVALLAPAFTDVTSAILSLLADTHNPASGVLPIVVDPTTQSVSFNIQSFVNQLSLPVNSAALTGLKTLINTNTFITSITYNPATLSFDMVYNTGLTSSFSYGISTTAGNSLSYGTDGRPYFNIGTLQVLP